MSAEPLSVFLHSSHVVIRGLNILSPPGTLTATLNSDNSETIDISNLFGELLVWDEPFARFFRQNGESAGDRAATTVEYLNEVFNTFPSDTGGVGDSSPWSRHVKTLEVGENSIDLGSGSSFTVEYFIQGVGVEEKGVLRIKHDDMTRFFQGEDEDLLAYTLDRQPDRVCMKIENLSSASATLKYAVLAL